MTRLLISLLLLTPVVVVVAFTTTTIKTTIRPSRSLYAGSSQEYIPAPQDRDAPQGGDMAYIETNIQRQMNTYAAIRNIDAVDCIRDVYVRAAPQSTCWYVGKLAFCGTTEETAIVRQLNLIQEHACRLRPVELGRAFGRLDVYTAPADSEDDVASNTVALKRMPASTSNDDDEPKLTECGFLCEVVTNQGTGFRVERAPDGGILPSEFE